MKKTLMVLAAGLGSRYGGIKQIAPIGPNGEILIHYAIYDAVLAGFEKIVFVIKIEANSNGSRPPLQSWKDATPPEGFAFLTDAQKDVFYSTVPAGFVNLTVEEQDGISYVASIEVNQEALDAYKATLPDPTDSAKSAKIAEIKQSCEDYICAGTE